MLPIPLNFKYGEARSRVTCKTLAIEGMYEIIPQFLTIWKDYVERKTNLPVCINEICWENGTLRALKQINTNIHVVCDHVENTITYPMDESYELRIKNYTKGRTNDSELSIEILSPNQYGLMHALKTLLLLLEFDDCKRIWTLPVIDIIDKPVNLWRGLLVDPARHFISVDTLKKIIRVMCILKYNVLHLHLSDDQGFCFESKFAGENFYTKKELKDVCIYANDLGIRVIPEIDIPGHVSQMIYKCPNLGTKTIPSEPETRNCLLKPALNVLSENVIKELAILFKEMMDVFQDKFFHLGGDEVDYSDWKGDRKILEYMKEMNYGNDFKLLQIDFTKRIYNIIFKPYGKIIICWDELYHKDLFKSFFSDNELVIQRWRNNHVLQRDDKNTSLSQCGGNVINSWGHYLNRLYPSAYYYKTTPNVASTKNNKVIGGEGCLWGNLLSDTNIMSTLIPNICPVAEQLWSSVEFTDDNVLNMHKRLDQFDDLLLLIEPDIDHQNASLKLPDMSKCLESIWGGFTKGHPRNSLDRRCNVEMRKIEDCVLPESRFVRNLYEYTRKMIHAYKYDEDNPYPELIYGEYKTLRMSVGTYGGQLETFNDKMNEIYGSLSERKTQRTMRKRNKRVKPPAIKSINQLTIKRNSSDDSDQSSSESSTPKISPKNQGNDKFRSELKKSISSFVKEKSEDSDSRRSSDRSSEDLSKSGSDESPSISKKSPVKSFSKRSSISGNIPSLSANLSSSGTILSMDKSKRMSLSRANSNNDNSGCGSPGRAISPGRNNSPASSNTKKEWTSLQKIVDKLCECGILSVYNSATTQEYESMLEFIESVESKYHDNMYIALCPAVKILVMFRLNRGVYVPSIMQKLNKTKNDGTWLSF